MYTPLATTKVQSLPECITSEFLNALRTHGVVSAFLFGSVANGSAGPGSDLDVLVTFDHPLHLFEQMDLAEELSRLCGRHVDLMTSIDPAFLPYIQPTLVALPL